MSSCNKMKIEYQSIGIVHSPFSTLENMPIQPTGAAGIAGRVEIFPEYEEGLQDLAGFSHIILLYHFHRSKGFKLRVVPFLDSESHGVFATRAPRRPNPIGLSVVKLVKITGRILHIENVDLLDKTPVLDIKPYVPEFDRQTAVQIGWLERVGRDVAQTKSDRRFK
jgi:tRNA-Thr(GGU) m(6)t(6)A37 methyltransferase TsaA